MALLRPSASGVISGSRSTKIEPRWSDPGGAFSFVRPPWPRCRGAVGLVVPDAAVIQARTRLPVLLLGVSEAPLSSFRSLARSLSGARQLPVGLATLQRPRSGSNRQGQGKRFAYCPRDRRPTHRERSASTEPGLLLPVAGKRCRSVWPPPEIPHGSHDNLGSFGA